MADLIAQGARAAGGEADLIQAADFDSSKKLDGYDAFAFGCPAMGDEELEEMEFLPMYDEVEPHLPGRKVALFGSYDWNDGEWMELWEKRAEEAGVDVVDSVIAKDYPDDDASADCMRLGTLMQVRTVPASQLRRREDKGCAARGRGPDRERKGLATARRARIYSPTSSRSSKVPFS